MPFIPLSDEPRAIQAIEDLADLNCLILGNEESLSNDLAAYLQSAGANVEQVTDFSQLNRLIQRLTPGLWLVVIDAGQEGPSIDELRAAFEEHSEKIKAEVQNVAEKSAAFIEPRFVVIKRGRRRQARIEDIDIITLDGDVMYRQSLLRAMAIAAGRIDAREEKMPIVDSFKQAPVPISREEALRQGKLILVAEDNEINQKVIRQQLNLLGYAADIANDGVEALKRLQQCNYGLLLTDLHMPEMDGFDLTEKIRAAEAGLRHLPIVALTANALKGEREHCLSVGMDNYLSKPVQLEDLHSLLEKYLPSSKLDSKIQSNGKSIESTDDIKAISSVVDVSVLKELVGNDPATIKELLSEFRTDTEKIALEMLAAYQSKQFAVVGSLAHKLKSSSRSVGAIALGNLCAEIEQAGKENDATTLAIILPKFNTQLAAVKSYLESNES